MRTIEREQSFERLGQQHQLATIGQIAASIAHDIRNPLTSISGFVQLMEKSENREYLLEYYQIIRSEITRIDSLLREVLVLSKSHTIESGALQPVDMGNLLRRILLLLEPEALRANIQVMINVKGNPIVEASEERLHQVFLNLLRNAIEAIAQEGIVEICLSEQNGECVVAIRDSGPGIPTDQIDHLFTPFFTTKSEGTGLGLSICQSIICSYGGTIAVNNLPGRGAEFIIMLPPKLKL
jgi:signal transduction histidine kinase